MAGPRILLGVLLASSLALTSTADIQEDALVADETALLQLSPSRVQTMRGQTGLGMPMSNARGAYRKTGKTGGVEDWPEPDDPDFEITDVHRQMIGSFKDAVRDGDVDMINSTVMMMALLPVALEVEEGVHDVAFQVIRDYQDDKYQYVQQMAWRGLSDQSHTELGSEKIAHSGGPNKGVEYMVEQLLAHPFYYGYRYDLVTPETVQAEALVCLAGLLLWDVNNTRGPAALEAGLIPAVMRTFKGEPNLRQSQWASCAAIHHVLYRNPDWSVYFKNAGALYYIDQAIERFKDGDDTEFYFGVTYGEAYNMSVCDYPKALMEGDLKKAAESKAVYLAQIQLEKPWATTTLTSI